MIWSAKRAQEFCSTNMLTHLRALWQPPILEESDAGDRARLAFLLARLLMIVALVGAPILLIADFPTDLRLAPVSLTWSLGYLLIMLLVHRGHWWVATWAIPSMVLLSVVSLALIRDVSFDIVVCGVLLAAVTATLLLRRTGALVFGSLGIAFAAELLWLGADAPGVLTATPFLLPVHLVLLVGFLFTGVMVIGVIAAHLDEVSRRDRSLAAQLAANHRELDAALVALQAQTMTIEGERAQLAQHVATRTAELVEANRELSRALQGRNEFLTSVSHELRTPLNAIIGLSDALVEKTYGELNDRQERSLRTVNESGRQLLNIINDLLDVAKLEAGRIVLLPVSISIEELAQSCIDAIRADASYKGIRVHYRCDPRLTTVWADSQRLKQILGNLLSNAVKFTNPNGEIGLEIDLSAAGDAINFTVWDTGIGIAADELPRLFQPFVQLDGRLNRRYGGTGLGLVITRRLAELHHGSISVHSVVGQGSRFVVSLPNVAAALPTVEAMQQQAQGDGQIQNII